MHAQVCSVHDTFHIPELAPESRRSSVRVILDLKCCPPHPTLRQTFVAIRIMDDKIAIRPLSANASDAGSGECQAEVTREIA